jgi:drug/metabolite transporter (DMT)-like permease
MPSSGFGLIVLVVIMVLCWSGNYIAAKIVFREMPAMLVMCLRTMVSCVLMFGIFAFTGNPIAEWSWREGGMLLALGFAGITMNQFFWTLGVERTTVVHSSMIMATVPVWVLVMAGLLGLEPVTFPKLAGMAIAMAGVAMLQIFKSKVAGHAPTLLGDFLVLLCALLLAALTAAGKRFRPRSGGVAVNAAGYVIGALVFLPVLWSESRVFDFSHVSRSGWLAVLYMGAMSSVTGYMIYYYALARMPASRIAAFQYLQPVFATLMAVVMLGENLTGGAAAAGAVIFAGVFVTERFG